MFIFAPKLCIFELSSMAFWFFKVSLRRLNEEFYFLLTGLDPHKHLCSLVLCGSFQKLKTYLEDIYVSPIADI